MASSSWRVALAALVILWAGTVLGEQQDVPTGHMKSRTVLFLPCYGTSKLYEVLHMPVHISKVLRRSCLFRKRDKAAARHDPKQTFTVFF